ASTKCSPRSTTWTRPPAHWRKSPHGPRRPASTHSIPSMWHAPLLLPRPCVNGERRRTFPRLRFVAGRNFPPSVASVPVLPSPELLTKALQPLASATSTERSPCC